MGRVLAGAAVMAAARARWQNDGQLSSGPHCWSN